MTGKSGTFAPQPTRSAACQISGFGGQWPKQEGRKVAVAVIFGVWARGGPALRRAFGRLSWLPAAITFALGCGLARGRAFGPLGRLRGAGGFRSARRVHPGNGLPRKTFDGAYGF